MYLRGRFWFLDGTEPPIACKLDNQGSRKNVVNNDIYISENYLYKFWGHETSKHQDKIAWSGDQLNI